MSQSSSVLFGLDGVVVETVFIGPDGTRTVGVTTAAQWVGTCPPCATVSTRSKGWVTTRPRDIKIGPDRPKAVWSKRKWMCSNSSCDRRSFTESIPQIPPRARITGHAKAEMALAVLDDDRSVKAVAAAYGCSWNTCHTAVAVTADPILEVEPERVVVLGIDETFKPMRERARSILAVSRRRPFMVTMTNRVAFAGLVPSMPARARASCRLRVCASRTARLREYCQTARHPFGCVAGSHTGSALVRTLLTVLRP
ncbi:hypothetical protein C6369_002565 [Rhodococcus rhodochrous]|nr:hypothetical protein C6369_002565 [Rhodococcus rhodochrous]